MWRPPKNPEQQIMPAAFIEFQKRLESLSAAEQHLDGAFTPDDVQMAVSTVEVEQPFSVVTQPEAVPTDQLQGRSIEELQRARRAVQEAQEEAA